MNIYSIDQTLDSVRILEKKCGRESPQVFALTWIAWEQLEYRVLTVAARLDGWSASILSKALSINSSAKKPLSAERLIEKMTKVHPENFAGNAGETWKSINSFKPLRNRLFHGNSRLNPNSYVLGYEHLFPLVEDASWLAPVRLVHLEGRPVLGNVYRDLRRSSRIVQEDRNLENLLTKIGL